MLILALIIMYTFILCFFLSSYIVNIFHVPSHILKLIHLLAACDDGVEMNLRVEIAQYAHRARTEKCKP